MPYDLEPVDYDPFARTRNDVLPPDAPERWWAPAAPEQNQLVGPTRQAAQQLQNEELLEKAGSIPGYTARSPTDVAQRLQGLGWGETLKRAFVPPENPGDPTYSMPARLVSAAKQSMWDPIARDITTAINPLYGQGQPDVGANTRLAFDLLGAGGGAGKGQLGTGAAWGPKAVEYLKSVFGKDFTPEATSPGEIKTLLAQGGILGHVVPQWEEAMKRHEEGQGTVVTPQMVSGEQWSPAAWKHLQDHGIDPEHTVLNPNTVEQWINSGTIDPLKNEGEKVWGDALSKHFEETQGYQPVSPDEGPQISLGPWNPKAQKYLETTLKSKPPLQPSTAAAVQEMLTKGPEWAKAWMENSQPGEPGIGYANLATKYHNVEQKAVDAANAAKAAAEAKAAAAAQAKADKEAAKQAKAQKAPVTSLPMSTPQSAADILSHPAAPSAGGLTPEMHAGEQWSPNAKAHLQSVGAPYINASPNGIQDAMTNDPLFGGYSDDYHFADALHIHNEEVGKSSAQPPTPVPQTPTAAPAAPVTAPMAPVPPGTHPGWTPEAVEYLKDHHWSDNAKQAIKGSPEDLANQIRNGTWGDAGGHYKKALELAGVKPEAFVPQPPQGAHPPAAGYETPFEGVKHTGTGPMTHPQKGEMGESVTIQHPTKGNPEDWGKTGKLVTFTPGGPKPPGFGAFSAPTDNAGWVKERGTPIKEPPFQPHPGLPSGAGVVIVEPGGKSVWIASPTNGFGDKHALMKGRVESGMDQQTTALKEAYEESGLRIKLKGYLGDVVSPYSKTRYYLAERAGGDPTKMGWESQAVHSVPLDQAKGMLNPAEAGIMEKALGEIQKPSALAPKAKGKAKVGQTGQSAASILAGQPPGLAKPGLILGPKAPAEPTGAQWNKLFGTWFPPLKVPQMEPYKAGSTNLSKETAPGTSGKVLPFNPHELPMDLQSLRERMMEGRFFPLENNWAWWRGVHQHGPVSWNTAGVGYKDPVKSGLTEPGIFLHPHKASVTGQTQSGREVAGSYGSLVNPHLVSTLNPKIIDWKTETGHGTYSGHHMQDQIKTAWQQGHDALLIKKIADVGSSKPHDQLIVRYPHQLRHPGAAFDPAFKMDPNLLGGNLGPFPLGVQAPQEEKQRRTANAR